MVDSSTIRRVSTNTRDFSGTAAAAATLVIKMNPYRQGVQIVNTSANPIYVGLDRPPATGQGIALNANGGSYEIDSNNMFKGDIYITGSAAAETFTAQEVSG